jgi:hypothetical protein
MNIEQYIYVMPLLVRHGTICTYISMYPSRDGNHLSLFLNMTKMNDLSKDSGNLIEFTLSIKDQHTGKHHKITGLAIYSLFLTLFIFLENVGRCQFAKNARVWGWSKFISLEIFKDSSKCYLMKKSAALKPRLQLLVPPRWIRLLLIA